MRRVVCSVSSNVELPVLPDARMEMRIEMPLSSGNFQFGQDDGKERRRRQRKNEPVEENQAR
jgi:hypothetical protein